MNRFSNRWYNDKKQRQKRKGINIKKMMKIEGMTCEHCVRRVKNALEEIIGLSNVEVDLDAKVATFDATDDVKDSDIKYAVEEVGYEVVNVEIV